MVNLQKQMTNLEEIYRSQIETDNLEDIKTEDIFIADVVRSLVSHPLQILSRWNWKSATLGAVFRASFYFTVYKASKENWSVTLTAVFVEFAFRFFTSGISGALVQSFRRATPAWLATSIVTISLPIFGHTVEFITHYIQETFFADVFAAAENKARQKAFAVSVLISVLSAMFNIFIFRKGVLLVGAGAETKSLWGDVKSLPLLIIEFIGFLPMLIIQFVKEKKFLNAIGVFTAFGLGIGSLLGVFRGKFSWAWTTAIGAWAILFVITSIVAIGFSFKKRRN
jgi:hypothetical protein